MKTVLIDTNIVLDVLLNRDGFNRSATALWVACETGNIRGVVSAITLNNAYFVCSKLLGRAKALEAVRLTLAVFKPIALDDKILRLAVASPGKDFEDAIQLYSALEARAFCIITRNARDFPNGMIRLLSPEEFLATLPLFPQK